jgi:acetyltransferase EpsM
MKENRNIIILGASAFAEEVADIISQIGNCEIVCFIEGIDRKKCNEKLLGLPIVWIDDVRSLQDDVLGICAVGSTKRKHFIEQAVREGLVFTTAIHPSAQVSATSKLGKGTIVSPGAIIAAYASVGSHVIINRGALIGHHTKIGNYVTISPGANIAGRVTIGECCYIGMGAVIVDGVTIGDSSIVGAGSVVTKDVRSKVQVIGAPAKVVRSFD